MMEIEDQDSAKYRKSKSKDMTSIIEFDLMIIRRNRK